MDLCLNALDASSSPSISWNVLGWYYWKKHGTRQIRMKATQFATDNAFELARLRGEASKLELLDEAGPMLTPGEVAAALGKTKQAVHHRLRSGSLFGIMNKGEFRIPSWQIREREVVPGIDQVLHNLNTTQWGKLLFLHSENMQLGGRRPVDLILAGDSARVAQVAATFGEEGAK
jgi:hypothetical protein